MATAEANIKNENILEVRGVEKEFNGVWVLKDIDFDLKQGEIHSIIGENGAGKSTFIKILAGVHQPSAGEISFCDKSVSFANVKQSEDAGIRTVHQEVNLVPYFSVYENIFVGAEKKKKFAGLSYMDDNKMKAIAIEVIKSLGIDFDVNTPAVLLNASMKRIVEISKVLVHNPKMVIFDEPTTSLGEEERKRLLNIIKGLKESGLSIIYISHNLEEVMEISDRTTVFRDGKKIGTMDREEATVEKIISMMLGHKSYNNYQRECSYCCEDIHFQAENIYTDRLKDISFDLKKGEILGIAGVVGAGKTEIAKAIFGLDAIEKGHIKVMGKEYLPSPQKAIANGIALVPEERQAEGLIPNYCISKNTTLTYLDKWTKRLVINRKEEISITNEYIEKLNIKTTGPLQTIKFLSGGNQQKVILSRWLNGDFKIGIFDEPTKGIDIKAKEDIYKLLDNLAKEGKSILMLSSYLPELLGLCDRILVVNDGKIVGEYNPKEDNAEHAIMAAMLGGKA
ncbi:MAG: sugar ABC transporter ATP-binding protein [Clostridia bacterium]